MTLFAIVGLVAAAVFWTQAGVRGAEAKGLRDRVDRLEEQRDKLSAERDSLEQRLLEAEEDQGIDRPPCLGKDAAGRVRPLFRVTVLSEGPERWEYLLEQLWEPGDAEEALVPGFLKQQPAGRLSPQQFRDHAKRIYDYGSQLEPAGDRCSFYAELKRGSSVSLAQYSRASSEVQFYFLPSNSGEVLRERSQDR